MIDKKLRRAGIIFFSAGFLMYATYLWGETQSSGEVSDKLEQELQLMLVEDVPKSGDPDRLLELARVYLDLGYGVYGDKDKKLSTFKEGARVAQRALEFGESSPEGHFLYAANLGSAAELEGLVSSVLIIKELKDHVNRVLELDPKHGPAHHMLGRLYEELPWFLGGDQEAAGSHLKKAVLLNGLYAPGRLDLAKWYLKRGETDLAVKELTQVVEVPPLKKKWVWERRHRPEAQRLLQQILSPKETDP